jgi:4-amino-4-deoxy-L-arabinose transferase-like glycosyltransferase
MHEPSERLGTGCDSSSAIAGGGAGGIQYRRARMTSVRPSPLLLCCLLGFALRLVLALSASEAELFSIDGREYREIAEHLVRGEGLSITSPRWFEPEPPGGFARRAELHRPPLLPLLGALLHHLPGGFELASRVFAALLGALAIPLLHALGRALFDARAGLFAAALWAIYPPACLYAARFSTEGLAVLFLGASVRLALPRGPCSTSRALQLGMCVALAVLTRSNLLAPCALVLLCVARRAGLRASLLALGASSVLLLPWTIRNAVCGGAPAPVTSFAAYNAWLGLNDAQRAMYAAPFDGAFDEAQRRLYAEESPSRVRELERRGLFEPAAQRRFWWDEALRYLREEPAGAARILVSRALHFLSPAPLPASASRLAFLVALGATGGAFALAALALFRDRRAREPLLLAVVGAGFLAALPFVFHLRLRFPIVDPLAVVLAARGLALLLAHRRAHSAGSSSKIDAGSFSRRRRSARV